MGELLVLKVFEEAKKEQLQQLIRTIDIQSGNRMMEMLSEKYGFPIIDVKGVKRTSTEYIMLLFDLSDKDHLPKVWRLYGLQTPKISRAGIKNLFAVRESLGIPPNAWNALLPGWEEILVAGIYGRGEKAEQIKDYLMGMEAIARAEVYTEKHHQKSLREHVQNVIKEPISEKEIVEIVSKNTITISKDRYIQFLEMENKVLHLKAQRLSKRKNPLKCSEIAKIMNLRSSGARIKNIAIEIGRSPYAVWKTLNRKKD